MFELPVHAPPMHWSLMVQPFASLQDVPSSTKAFDGHPASDPLQLSEMSQSFAAGRQTCVAGAKASAGQATLVPSQLSTTSQSPADGRQVCELGWTESL